MEWTKKTVGWNNTLRQNHPEVDSVVFKKRNVNQFKYHIGPLILDGSYKQALLTAEELINLTFEPLEYKEDIYKYIEELLLQKDNSCSFKIGRIITMPVKIMLKLTKNIFK